MICIIHIYYYLFVKYMISYVDKYRLLLFLRDTMHENLQFESAWTLTSMSSDNTIITNEMREILINQNVVGCYKDDPIIQYQSTKCLRKFLSREQNPPIKEVINTGVVPRYITLFYITTEYVIYI